MINRLAQHWAYCRYRMRGAPESLSHFYQAGQVDLNADWRTLPMVALDLELTGLSPGKDQILSIATVSLDGGALQLASAWHQLVQIEGSVGQSCTIHGIHDRELEHSLPLDQALARLVPKLAGRVLICHHAALDLAFLRQGFDACFGEALPLIAIDTLHIEHRRLARQGETIKPASLTLAACRHRYGLPSYNGHHALNDALACGELLLAQCSQMAGTGRLTGQQLLKLSR